LTRYSEHKRRKSKTFPVTRERISFFKMLSFIVQLCLLSLCHAKENISYAHIKNYNFGGYLYGSLEAAFDSFYFEYLLKEKYPSNPVSNQYNLEAILTDTHQHMFQGDSASTLKVVLDVWHQYGTQIKMMAGANNGYDCLPIFAVSTVYSLPYVTGSCAIPEIKIQRDWGQGDKYPYVFSTRPLETNAWLALLALCERLNWDVVHVLVDPGIRGQAEFESFAMLAETFNVAFDYKLQLILPEDQSLSVDGGSPYHLVWPDLSHLETRIFVVLGSYYNIDETFPLFTAGGFQCLIAEDSQYKMSLGGIADEHHAVYVKEIVTNMDSGSISLRNEFIEYFKSNNGHTYADWYHMNFDPAPKFEIAPYWACFEILSMVVGSCDVSEAGVLDFASNTSNAVHSKLQEWVSGTPKTLYDGVSDNGFIPYHTLTSILASNQYDINSPQDIADFLQVTRFDTPSYGPIEFDDDRLKSSGFSLHFLSGQETDQLKAPAFATYLDSGDGPSLSSWLQPLRFVNGESFMSQSFPPRTPSAPVFSELSARTVTIECPDASETLKKSPLITYELWLQKAGDEWQKITFSENVTFVSNLEMLSPASTYSAKSRVQTSAGFSEYSAVSIFQTPADVCLGNAGCCKTDCIGPFATCNTVSGACDCVSGTSIAARQTIQTDLPLSEELLEIYVSTGSPARAAYFECLLDIASTDDTRKFWAISLWLSAWGLLASIWVIWEFVFNTQLRHPNMMMQAFIAFAFPDFILALLNFVVYIDALVDGNPLGDVSGKGGRDDAGCLGVSFLMYAMVMCTYFAPCIVGIITFLKFNAVSQGKAAFSLPNIVIYAMTIFFPVIFGACLSAAAMSSDAKDGESVLGSYRGLYCYIRRWDEILTGTTMVVVFCFSSGLTMLTYILTAVKVAEIVNKASGGGASNAPKAIMKRGLLLTLTFIFTWIWFVTTGAIAAQQETVEIDVDMVGAIIINTQPIVDGVILLTLPNIRLNYLSRWLKAAGGSSSSSSVFQLSVA